MKNWTTLIPIQLKMVWWHTISTLSSEIDSLFSSGWFTGQGNFLFIYTRPSLNDVRQLNLPGGWGGALLLLGGRLINGCVDDNMGDMVDQSVNRVRLNVLIECLIGPFCLKNSNNNGTETAEQAVTHRIITIIWKVEGSWLCRRVVGVVIMTCLIGGTRWRKAPIIESRWYLYKLHVFSRKCHHFFLASTHHT